MKDDVSSPPEAAIDGPLVVVGVVGKPFGLSGACYVRPDPDVAHDFAEGSRLITADSELVICHRHDHGSRLVVKFAGMATRDDAERIRGTVLRVPSEQAKLDEDYVWASEVIGAEVLDPDGTVLGVVADLADGPAHDYLVVRQPTGAHVWVPAVAELVTIESSEVAATEKPSVGARSRRVVVRPPAGLFDPEQAESARPDPPSSGSSKPARGEG